MEATGGALLVAIGIVDTEPAPFVAGIEALVERDRGGDSDVTLVVVFE